MWLLDANDLSLRQIFEKDLEDQQQGTAPRYPYGILSHRWEADDQEPSFEDYRFGPPSKTNKGIRKIAECCRIAKDHGLNMVWSDTCCIDKRSSAELQEAINSMYRFYQQASICFVYLSDVTAKTFDKTFTKSEWFRRGWTLQELIAPTDLRFYDSTWTYIGDKKTLSHQISAATGIQCDVLTGEIRLQDCSVAQRMSWAANRVTTRIEDKAYSLLGIFDVNMPMLYGEGPKSFLRLQEEIIKTLDDHSIFVWEGLRLGSPGLLAPSPNAFASSSDIQNIRDRKGRRPYVMNNRGVHGMIPLIPYTLDTYLTLLPCTHQGQSDPSAQVGIFLRRMYEDDQYLRVAVQGKELMHNATAWVLKYGFHRMCVARSISIRQQPLLREEMDDAYMERILGFQLSENLLKMDAAFAPLFSIQGSWHSGHRIVSLQPGSNQIHNIGSIEIGLQEQEIEVIRFGFDLDYNPVVYLTQRGIRYSGKEDKRGVFMQNFKSASEDEGMTSLLPSGETFQNAMPAIGGNWSSSHQLPNGAHIAQVSAALNGFWALKADRLDGLDVNIVRTVRHSEQNRLLRIGRVRLHRTTIDKRLLWNLHVDDLAPRRLDAEQVTQSGPANGVGNSLPGVIKQMTEILDSMKTQSTGS